MTAVALVAHPARTVRAVVLLAAFACTTTSFAGYRESYGTGRAAADNGDWATAKAEMQRAIADRPEASRKNVRIYGMRLEPYIPHFHLGVALYQLGQCEPALVEWQASESQGVVQGTRWHKELEELRSECRARVQGAATPTPAPRGPDPEVLRATSSAKAAVERAESAAADLTDRIVDPRFQQAWQAEATLATQRETALRSLDNARSQLQGGEADGDLDRLQEAARLAVEARQQLSRIASRLEVLREEMVRASDSRRDPTPLVTSTPLETRELRLTPVPTPRQEPRISPTHTATPAAVPTPSGPSRILFDAATAFVDGEHHEVIRLLEAPVVSGRREEAVVHLLRAASRFVLYRRNAGRDSSLLHRAESDVRSCRSLHGSVRPDRESYPASFVEFFDGVK